MNAPMFAVTLAAAIAAPAALADTPQARTLENSAAVLNDLSSIHSSGSRPGCSRRPRRS